MQIREGLIPTVLGTVVTGTGYALRNVNPTLGAAVMGFWLAHVLLGGIDLVEHTDELEGLLNLSWIWSNKEKHI